MIWKKDSRKGWVIKKFMGTDWSNVDWSHIGKQPCPHCREGGRDKSGNNLHTYGLDEEGRPKGGKCYSEELVIVSVEKALEDAELEKIPEKGNKSYGGSDKKMSTVAEKTESKEKIKLKKERLSNEDLKEILENTGDDPKGLRGLDKEISRKYGIRYQYSEVTGKATLMMVPAYIEEDGEFHITGYKCRDFDIPKKEQGHFYPVGYVGRLNCFMGQNLVTTANHLLIVGGEIDVIAADTIFQKYTDLAKYKKDYLIVCGFTGEPSTYTTCKQNYSFVTKFRSVTLALDNDEAGKSATDEIIKVLPNNNLYTTKLTYKDPWVYWEKLKRYKDKTAAKLFEKDIHWDRTLIQSFGIVGSKSLLSKAIEHVLRPKIPLPKFMRDLDDFFTDGIGLGEIMNIISNTSTGKSVYVNEIISDWVVNSPYKMMIFSLEDGGGSYGTKIASRIIGRKIHRVKGAENRAKILRDNWDLVMNFLTDPETGEDAFYLLEEAFSDLEQVKEAILQAIKVHDCKIIVIDPLVNLISHKSLEEQINFMIFEEECRRIYDVTFINVCHTVKISSRGGGKSASQGGDINEEDVKGTSQITGGATINMIIRRNKMAECEIERNTTEIDIVKNRTDGETGRSVAKIFYHGATHTLIPYSIAEAKEFYQNGDKPDLKNDYIHAVVTQDEAEADEPEDEIQKVVEMDFN